MDLASQQCTPYAKGSAALSAAECITLQKHVPDWAVNPASTAISCEFRFKNYYETIAFVNAVAWICHQQDHHPDLVVSYNRCQITFITHSVVGLTQNDFICAARIDRLVEQAK